MTISGYSNAIVDLMLGWLKGLANWVLRLFNLAGSAGGSPPVGRGALRFGCSFSASRGLCSGHPPPMGAAFRCAD